MKERSISLLILSFIFVINVSCVTFVTRTDWLAKIPFEQGIAKLSLGQEKPYMSPSTYPYGSLSIKLITSEKITDVKLLIADVKLLFFKNGQLFREMEIFLHDFNVNEHNEISAFISKYDKYITPAVDKKYSLNWDEFIQAAETSDKIQSSIVLKFEANGQFYSIQKTGELKKDVNRKLYRGIYD